MLRCCRFSMSDVYIGRTIWYTCRRRTVNINVSSISTSVVNQEPTRLSRVWFGSGRNKFVQLLIRSRNSNGRFIRSLARTRSRDIHLFTINHFSLDTHWCLPPAPEPRWHVKKTPPLTELQIPATVTTLFCYKRRSRRHVTLCDTRHVLTLPCNGFRR